MIPRRALALPLLCAGLCAGAACAEAPRSAIPWLSQSIAATPADMPAPAGARAAPAPPPGNPATITVAPLGEISRDAVGLLPPARTGFPRDLWGERPAGEVRQLVLTRGGDGVPAAIGLFREILLAEADPPPGADPSSALLVARIDRLLGMGALEEAEALIEAAGPNSPELFRRWFDVGLLLDRAEPPCAALKGNPSLSPTLPARVFCLARGGDWNAAEITLTLGKGVGSIPEAEEELLARFLDPVIFEEEAEPPVPDPLTPLDFLLREAVGLSRPTGPLPLAFLRGDLGEHAPVRTRIDASERLWLAGALSDSDLVEAYRAGEPAASGGVWDRARAVQQLDAALRQSYPEALGKALVAADDALSARGLRVALAKSYAPALRPLKAETLGEPARARLAQLLLLGGQTEAGAAAARGLSDPRLAALADLARGAAPAAAAAEPATAAFFDRLAAIRAGLAAGEPADDREAMLRALATGGQTGAAMLESLDLLGPGAETDPQTLRAGLFGLRAAGAEAAARRIAVETLLAHPLS